MKKPLIILAAVLLLIGMCGYLYYLVQPEAESDTLLIRWHAGGGQRGQVTGIVQDVRGRVIAGQKFRLYTKEASVECQANDAGQFAAQLPAADIVSIEVPGSEILHFGAVAPSAEEGVSLTVIVR